MYRKPRRKPNPLPWTMPEPESGESKGRLIVVFEKPDGNRYAWEKDIPLKWILRVERFYEWLSSKELQDLIRLFDLLKSLGLI